MILPRLPLKKHFIKAGTQKRDKNTNIFRNFKQEYSFFNKSYY